MNEKFILMNKNKPLIKFEYLTNNNEFGTIYDLKISEIKKDKQDIFPISLETTEEGLKEWIETRKVPKNRAFVEKILGTLVENENSKHPMDYIKVSFGLSLNDSYWIIPDDGKQYLWENYNLYKNKFSKTLSLVAFTGYNSQIKDVRTSPEYTTNGMLKKCWHQKEDGIYLLKGATEEYSNSGKEHYSEFYSAQVAEILGLNHIEYDLEKFHDELVSSCKLFTSENVGYEPMVNVFKNKNIKYIVLDARTIYEIKNLLKEEFIKFEDMMLFDAIIGNKDRHLGNFGILNNNNTGELISLAPIFDNGLSMLNCMTKNEISDKEYLKKFNLEKTNSFNQTFDEAMKIFSNKRHIVNLIKLKNFKVKKHEQYNLDDEWLSGFEKNIRLNAEKCLEIIKEKNFNNSIYKKDMSKEKIIINEFIQESLENKKLIDVFIEENHTNICNNLRNEIIDYFKENFIIDEVFEEINEQSANDFDNEMVKDVQNIFEKEVLNIVFEKEEKFFNIYYEGVEKRVKGKIDNYDRQDIENIFYEKISFIKEDLILELIENKILNFEEKYQEMININKEKQQNQIQEEKQKS